MNNNIIRNVTVTVDMNRMNRVVNTRAVFNQRDVKTAVILCNIDMGGLVNLSNCTVKADILKPDGTNVVTLCQILDEEKGLVAIGLNNQCLSAIGEVRCELSIQSESQTLYSPVLVYNVVDNLFDLENEEITSQNDYPILSQLISLVQNIETELEGLELVIQTNELDRNNSEKIRKQNEILRQEYYEQVKNDIENMNRIFNEKVDVISSELERLDSDVSNSIGKLNDTITDIQNSFYEISNSFDGMIEIFNSKIEGIDDKLVIFDSKILEINTTMSECIDSTDANISKMNETIDSNINRMDDAVNTFITDIKTSNDNSVINMKNVIDEKIIEISNNLDNINTTISDKMTYVDDVLTTKIDNVENTISIIEVNESSRIQAEKDRETRYNNLISKFTIVETDISDIISMIGG